MDKIREIITKKFYITKDKSDSQNVKIAINKSVKKLPKSDKNDIVKNNLRYPIFRENRSTMRVRDGGTLRTYGGLSHHPPSHPRLPHGGVIRPSMFRFLKDDYDFIINYLEEYSLNYILENNKKVVGVKYRDMRKFKKRYAEMKRVLHTKSFNIHDKSSFVTNREYINNFVNRNHLKLGFDSEWTVHDKDPDKVRHVDSYQFYFETESYRYSVIFYPESKKQLRLGDMLYFIVNNVLRGYGFSAVREGLDHHKYPFFEQSRLILISHFGGVDYSICSDWRELLSYQGFTAQERKKYFAYCEELKNCNKQSDIEIIEDKIKTLEHKRTHRTNMIVKSKHSVFTTSERVYNFWISAKQGRCEFRVEIRDTMELAPPKAPLLSLGEAMGIPKLDTEVLDVQDGLVKGYYKRHMNELLVNHPEFFERYALQDAKITYKWYEYITTVARDGVTAPAISASITRDNIKEYCLKNGIAWEGYDKTVRGYSYDKHQNPDYYAFYKSRGELGDWPDKAYYGGNNQAFSHGWVDGATFDLDLLSAYPFAMMLIPRPDWDKDLKTLDAGHIMTLDDWDHIHQPGFGYVEFEFPKDVKYPCIPLKSNKRGLEGTPVFLRKGSGLVSAPDVYSAIKLGARVTVGKNGFKFVPIEKDKIHFLGIGVRTLVEQRAENARIYGKRSPQALILKLLANALYGKTGQGLHGNRERNILDDEMEDVPNSSVTDGVVASTITAVVRQTLALVMNFISDNGYRVESVTTDGFITNAPQSFIKDIDCYLDSVSPTYKQVLHDVWGTDSTSILEIKHENTGGFLNIKTRGNIALNKDGVFATAGFTGDRMYRQYDKQLKRAYLLFEIVNRNGRVQDYNNTMHSLYDLKHSHKKQLDKVFKRESDKYKSLSFDFDTKRFLLQTKQTHHFKLDYDCVHVDLDYPFFDTRPFEDMREYEHYADVFKKFINHGHNVKDRISYHAFELALKRGMPDLHRFEGVAEDRLTPDERKEKKRAFSYYQARQYFRVLFSTNEFTKYNLFAKTTRKEYIEVFKEIYDIDVLNIYKDELKARKKNKPIDLLTGLYAQNTLIRYKSSKERL